jgi:hypothetical protein
MLTPEHAEMELGTNAAVTVYATLPDGSAVVPATLAEVATRVEYETVRVGNEGPQPPGVIVTPSRVIAAAILEKVSSG